MKISRYIIDYTSNERILFKHIVAEFVELLVEIVKFNWQGAKEEWQDTLHFVQLWLYWKFNKDAEIWDCTMDSVNKFMNRVRVWHDLYEYVGLPRNISNFCGNYKRPEKVVRQLAKYNISEERAKEAYHRIVVES